MITGPESARMLTRPTAIFLEGRLPVLEARLVQTLGLHDGQIVRPTVEVRATEVKLVLQGRLIDAPAGLRLVPGETQPLRVQMLPNGQAVLHPVAAPADTVQIAAASAPLATLQRVERLAYRPPVMEALLHLLRPGVLQGMLQTAPQPEAGEWVQRLLKLRPNLAQLTPAALRDAVLRSGWLTEAMLSHGRGADAADGDSKLLLRQLLRSWTDAPAALRSQISEAIDDIEAGQLRGARSGVLAEAAVGRELVFALAVPFADADPVSIRMYREGRSEGEGKPVLTVHLHSRSSELGELWLQTRIADTQVDLVMWAVREDVVRRAEQDSGGLARALAEAGLLLTGLQVIHGPRTPDAADDAPPAPGRLVDLQV